MKRTKRIASALLAVLMIAAMTGCSVSQMKKRLNKMRVELNNIISGSDTPVSDTDDQPQRIDIMLEALDKRDGELFKSVFSETALTLADDMDKGLEYIFSIYEGEFSDVVYSNSSFTRHYGDYNTVLANPIYVLHTTADKYYCLRYSVWSVEEAHPEAVGVYSLDFFECAADRMGGGGGGLFVGINYPERNGAEHVAGGIADTMITREEKYIREVMSDELLATDGIQKKITAFAEDYSAINPSTIGDCWVRVTEQSVRGYLVMNTNPRTFIVFETSKEQPDKMSGMKVTIVDRNAPLPTVDIAPEGVEMNFPKFPHPPVK